MQTQIQVIWGSLERFENSLEDLYTLSLESWYLKHNRNASLREIYTTYLVPIWVECHKKKIAE